MQLALAFIGGLGIPEIALILVIGLVLFGGRLPEVGKSVARSLLEFKKGLRDLKDEAGLSEIEEIRDEVRDLARAPDYAYRREPRPTSLIETEQEIHDAAIADEEQRYPGEVDRHDESPAQQSGEGDAEPRAEADEGHDPERDPEHDATKPFGYGT